MTNPHILPVDREAAALAQLSREWHAGPDLPEALIPHLTSLREKGLVEREFGDHGDATIRATDDGFAVHAAACWWFRLTPEGLSLLTPEANHG
jgi:hypothetical protein